MLRPTLVQLPLIKRLYGLSHPHFWMMAQKWRMHGLDGVFAILIYGCYAFHWG